MLVDFANICCKEKGGIVECLDKTNDKREHHPFALSQGGAYSKQPVCWSVVQCKGGYIHAGLRKMLRTISGVNKNRSWRLGTVDDFFRVFHFVVHVSQPMGTPRCYKTMSAFCPIQACYAALLHCHALTLYWRSSLTSGQVSSKLWQT